MTGRRDSERRAERIIRYRQLDAGDSLGSVSLGICPLRRDHGACRGCELLGAADHAGAGGIGDAGGGWNDGQREILVYGFDKNYYHNHEPILFHIG